MKITVKIKDKKLQSLIGRLKNNTSRLKPALEEIRGDLEYSIDENFIKQGRPKKWKALKQSTIKRRRIKQQTSTKILQSSGSLAASINGKVVSNKIIIGSNKKYARIHNEGGTIRHPGGTKFKFISPTEVVFLRNDAQNYHGITKPHNITIPKRPFLLFQKKDIENAKKTLKAYLTPFNK